MKFLARFAALIFPVAVAVFGAVAHPAAGEERVTLGWGRLLNNDLLGDGEDRWRTSSYALSVVRGPEGLTGLPSVPGELLEHRFRFEIIAPRHLTGAGSADRAYAGVLSYGLHTHFARGRAEIALGLDLVATGPQTGVIDAQNWFHDLIGEPRPSASVVANQVADAIWPTLVAEVAFPIALSEAVEIRPFAGIEYGIEDLVRVGADVTIGQAGAGAILSRDSTTGHLIRTVKSPGSGWSVVAGADFARIFESGYFPDSFGVPVEETRSRARLGLHWQADESITFFYGVTWLSPEYQGQSEGQMVGSVKLNFNF